MAIISDPQKIKKSFEIKLKDAFRALEAGNLKKAKNLFQQCLVLDINNSEIHMGLGLVSFYEQSWNSALSYFQQANKIKQQPENFYFMGCVYYYSKKLDLAILNLQKATELKPDLATAYYLLGVIYEAVNELQKSSVNIQKAMSIDADVQSKVLNPNKFVDKIVLDVNQIVGSIVNEAGELPAKLLENLGSILKRKKDKSYVNYCLQQGEKFLDESKFKEAQFIFAKALETDKENALIYDKLGLTFFHLNKLSESLECFDKAVELESINALFVYHLGCAYLFLGKNKESLEILNQAVELDSNLAQAYYSMGMVYQKLQNYNKSYEFMEKAAKMVPDINVLSLIPGKKVVEISEGTLLKREGCLFILFKLVFFSIWHSLIKLISLLDTISPGLSKRLLKTKNYLERKLHRWE